MSRFSPPIRTNPIVPAVAPPKPIDASPVPEPEGTPQPAQLAPYAMPAELAEFLNKTQGFNPDLHRPEYEANKDLWKLYLDLYELDANSLKPLLDKHGSDASPEDATRYAQRQALATTYNLVPIIIRMVVSYVFSEAPQIDVNEDPDLTEFLKDCDCNGTPLAEWIKQTALPMTQVLGWVDVLVQNPLVSQDVIQSMADAQDSEYRPSVYPIYARQRINWSTRTNHAYNWICFVEKGSEDTNPLRRNVLPRHSYITLSAAVEDVNPLGFWIRSWRPFEVTGTGTPAVPPPPIPDGAVQGGAGFVHEGDFFPTKRVPVATLYWQKSNDPDRRHFGISKIALIAVLTKSIINILSWTTEDVLANLAILALPTKGGGVPKDVDGKPVLTSLNAFSFLCYNHEAKHEPSFVQGETRHIEVKLKLITMHMQEILRLANLLGASAEAERISSGVQGVVMRNELFRELKDAATSLDAFTLEVLALAKSWATGQEWDVQRMQKEGKVSVRFFKGPYATEPMAEVIKSAAAAIEMLREVSPSAAEYAYESTVRALIPADSPVLPEAVQEIEDNIEGHLAKTNFQADLATNAVGGAASGAAGTDPMEKVQADAEAVQTGLQNDLRNEKKDYTSNVA